MHPVQEHQNTLGIDYSVQRLTEYICMDMKGTVFQLTQSESVSHSHTYINFAHAIDLSCLTNFEKIRIYQVWFLFGVIPGVGSYSRHFGTINK